MGEEPACARQLRAKCLVTFLGFFLSDTYTATFAAAILHPADVHQVWHPLGCDPSPANIVRRAELIGAGMFQTEMKDIMQRMATRPAQLKQELTTREPASAITSAEVEGHAAGSAAGSVATLTPG
eukprot:1724472-Amphidinium_carterae.1